MLGIGLDCGMVNFSPCCNLRKRTPASCLASAENGGDLTAPCNQTSGLSLSLMARNYMSYLTYKQESEALPGIMKTYFSAVLTDGELEIASPPNLSRLSRRQCRAPRYDGFISRFRIVKHLCSIRNSSFARTSQIYFHQYCLNETSGEAIGCGRLQLDPWITTNAGEDS